MCFFCDGSNLFPETLLFPISYARGKKWDNLLIRDLITLSMWPLASGLWGERKVFKFDFAFFPLAQSSMLTRKRRLIEGGARAQFSSSGW